jgi:Flp pilus assembly protein TadD
MDVILMSGQASEHIDLLLPLKARPDRPADLDAQMGVVYIAAGDHSTARELVRKARIKNPTCARTRNLEGLIAYGEGRPDVALAKFQEAADLAPDWGTPWSHMATLYWEQEDTDNALISFEKGFALSPTAPNVAADYHTVLRTTGRFDRARSMFVKTVQRHPNFLKGWYFLIDILIQVGADDEAMAAIETVILNFGADANLLNAADKMRKKLGPLQISDPSDITLSLCMIVKNEGAHMARCLSSLKPVVDEIIVVDTGSTDETKRLSEVFGAKVFDYAWTDDFAAARNFSLSKARGRWILVMDADEAISPLDYRRLKQLLRKQRTANVAFSVTTRNYTNLCNLIDWTANDNTYPKEEAGTGWTSSEKVRLFPNRPDIRFDYPVHEVVRPSLDREGIKIEKCPIPVHHYGHMDPSATLRKGEAYYQIGIGKLQKMEHDPIAIQELAIQAGMLGRPEEAVDLWHKLLALEPDNSRAYVNLSTTYDQLGRYNDARSAALRAVDLNKDLKEAHFNIARAELHLGHATKAAAYLKPLVVKNRDYYAAQFTLGCALICNDSMQEGLDVISSLKTTSLWPAIAYSFEEIAQSLLNAAQNDYSVKVHQAASRLELSIQLAIEAQDPAPVLSRASAG